MNVKTKKHVPQRTCLACREAKSKRELVRLVSTPGGVVEVDLGGRKPGRGAYLCRDLVCWEQGLRGTRLDHALRGSLSPEARAALLNQAKDIVEGAS